MRKPGSAGCAPVPLRACAREDEGDHEHGGQQHRHPQQFDIGGDVAGLRRDHIACADDLSDIVDRAADENARADMVEPDPGRENRITDHRQRR